MTPRRLFLMVVLIVAALAASAMALAMPGSSSTRPATGVFPLLDSWPPPVISHEMAMGPDGYLYLAPYGSANRQVTVVDRGGRLVRRWDSGIRNASGGSDAGIDVARDGSVWLVDQSGGVVSRWSASGSAVASWTYPGVRTPQDVCASSDGSVFLADTGNAVVRRLDASGVQLGTLRTFWTVETGEGMLTSPQGLVSDGSGGVFVGDRTRIVHFSGAAQTLGLLGLTGTIRPSAAGNLARDASGRVLVAEPTIGRVIVYGADGLSLGTLGTTADSIAMSRPWGVAADAAGTFYVLDPDAGGGRILLYGEGTATTITLSASAASVLAGSRVTFTGRLRHVSGVDLPGRPLVLESSSTGATWSVVATPTTGAGGSCSCAVTPSVGASYRLTFVGGGTLDPATSGRISVAVVRPTTVSLALARPGTVYRGRAYAYLGTMRPGGAAARRARVTLVFDRLVGASWRRYSTVSAAWIADYGSSARFRAAPALPYAGVWRVSARYPVGGGFTAASTAQIAFVVR